MDMLLEECTTENVKPLLNDIMKIILSESKTDDSIQKDIMFILVIVLLLENQFSLVNVEMEIIDPVQFIDRQQLCEWKSNTGVFEAMFVLPGLKNVVVKLIMSPLGATVLINLVITELNCDTYSVCIPLSRYVVSPQATSIPMIFRDLKHFSTTLKNKLISPVKSRVLSHLGYASASLIGIPEEICLKILIHLPIDDIYHVCKTCNRLKVLLDNETLWYTLYKRDFISDSDIDARSWKELYKEKYISEHDNKLRSLGTAAGILNDHMDYSDYVSFIDHDLWELL